MQPHVRAVLASPAQQVKGLSVLSHKPLDVVGAGTQEICNLLCRSVSEAHLNLIDEGLHATEPSNRRSRSAANTK